MTAVGEYATALYELASEDSVQDEVLEGLTQALGLMHDNPAYAKLLANPAVAKPERIALIENAFGGNIHRYAVSFIKILCEKSAIDILSACEGEYRRLLYKQRGILPVQARSASELTKAQSDKLSAKLKALTGKEILLSCSVDTSLIGGVCLYYDGQMLDGSVKGSFATLEKMLLEA